MYVMLYFETASLPVFISVRLFTCVLHIRYYYVCVYNGAKYAVLFSKMILHVF